MSRLLLVLILALLLPARSLAGALPGTADAYDVLILEGKKPPVWVRLLIEVSGRSLARLESDYFRDSFSGDLKRTLASNPLYRLLPGTRPKFDNLPRGVKPSEMAKVCLARSEGRFLQVKVLPAGLPHPALLSRALTTALAGQRVKVAKSLLKNADRKLLERFDIDEDECISPFELVPDLLTAAVPPAPARARSTILVVHPGQPADAWFPRLIDHYDSTRKGSLAPRDIDFDSATFAKLDRNSDGRISRAELLRWFDRAPDRTLTVTLGKEPACYPSSSPAARRFPPRPVASGGCAFDVGTQAAVEETDPAAVDPKTMLALFDESAEEGQVAIKRAFEIAFRFFCVACSRPPMAIAMDCRRAANWKAYLNLHTRAADGLATLWIEPQPRSWFSLLDVNRDGQLCVHELRHAWERLAHADAEKAGIVALPDFCEPAWTLTFVRGLSHTSGVPLIRPRRPGRGPEWFQAMDRNGDGFVSKREFIGSKALFERLDLDKDGLISPEEAAAASKLPAKGG